MLDANSQFFVGCISSSDAATYTTTVEVFGGDHKSPQMGIPLAGVFANTLGFKECLQYPVGAHVLCFASGYDTCIIMGIIPDNDIANLGFPSRAALKTADGTYDIQNIQGYNELSHKKGTFNANRPTDVVDGEAVFACETGTLLGLFQSLAVLKGSELAQIQCYLLDDLVRIVSHNYEHLHSMGEMKIFHDGKALMAEFGLTHDPREANGIAQVEEEKNKEVWAETKPPYYGTKGNDLVDYYEFLGDSRTKAIERVKGFVGKLGDMIHFFFTRPDPDAVRALNGDIGKKVDTGMADVHVSLDGRISLRTVTGASFEKTNWIMVPHRVLVPEDPNGDEVDDVDFEIKDPFNFDNHKLIRGNPTLYFLQMRDCNAYLQDFYNYKNFIKYKKDFAMSGDSQSDKENKLNTVAHLDPMTPTRLGSYVMRRSGLYLMDNGGIMIKDAWGSAIVMEGGDIYLQPAKDLVQQPMRNSITKAGKFVNISARKDIDLSSTEQGFRVKTKKCQHFYSDEQGIILQSNASVGNAAAPEEDAYDTFGGILLKSTQGIYSYGKTILDRADESALYKANNLYLESVEGKLALRTQDTIEMIATNHITMVAEQNLLLMAKEGTMNVLAGQSMNVGGKALNLGNQGTIIGMVPHPDSAFPAIMDGVLPVADLVDRIGTAYMKVRDEQDFQKDFSPFSYDTDFQKIKFRFLKSEAYRLIPGQDCIPMSIAQQDDAMFGTLGLKPWAELPVNDTLPYPGKELFNNFYVTCELKNLIPAQGDIYSKPVKDLKSEGGALKDASLYAYRINDN